MLTGGQETSQDLLDKIAASGMPPHKLALKPVYPSCCYGTCMAAHGLNPGTRLVVRRVQSRVIEAVVETGCCVGKVVYIPRINSTNTDSNLPFNLRRRQFPLRLASP